MVVNRMEAGTGLAPDPVAANRTDVLSLVGDIKQLPTPPVVFTQINRVVNSPDASVYDVARIIAEDPGMSARTLRMANSAYYALPQPVSSVRQAIVILGMDAIKSLALSSALLKTFTGYLAEPEFQNNFWRHSLATASAARVLFGSRTSDRVIRGGEEGFTAGLLHDIGKLVMVCHLPDLRKKVRAHVQFGVVEDRFAEQDALGVTHAEFGAVLAERWNLPHSLVSAIKYHHTPGAAPGGETHLAKIVHAADYLAHWMADIQRPVERLLPLVEDEVMAEFGITDATLPEIGAVVREEFGRSETFMEMARMG